MADGELAASTTHAEGHIQVWDTKRWVRTQLLQAVEAESGERARFVKHAARATTSCLALDGSTLVAGSREGCVNSWRRAGGADAGMGGGAGGGRAAFARRCRNLRADQGPVGAVLLLPGGRMLGVYQAARGTVDGDAFSGEQSVAAWTEGGQLLWRIAQPQPQPQQQLQQGQLRSPAVIGAALGGGGLMLLLGAPGADAEWNLVLPPDNLVLPPDQAAETTLSPPLLRVAPLPANDGKPPGWRQLRSDAVVGGAAGRPLAWHAEGCWVGVGFAGGAVCLLPPSAEAGGASCGGGGGAAAAAAAAAALHGAPCAHAGFGADVGAVLVMPAACALGGGGDGGGGGGVCLLSGCAAGLVRVWLPGPAAGQLEMVACVALPAGVAAAPRLQPSALAATRHHLLCGSAQVRCA